MSFIKRHVDTNLFDCFNDHFKSFTGRNQTADRFGRNLGHELCLTWVTVDVAQMVGHKLALKLAVKFRHKE